MSTIIMLLMLVALYTQFQAYYRSKTLEIKVRWILAFAVLCVVISALLIYNNDPVWMTVIWLLNAGLSSAFVYSMAHMLSDRSSRYEEWKKKFEDKE